MRILKANTAVRLVVGPLCDKTTGLAKTGMTVTNMAMNMWHEHDDGSAPTKSIDAVSFTASGGNNDMVELAGGYYDIEITAAQLNITAGRCRFCIYDDDVILPYFEEWLVVPANVFDSMMGTDKLDVNAAELGGTSQTGNDVGADVNDILADTGTDGVKLAPTQGAITWGQQKIIANVAGEGALHIMNSNAAGVGMRNQGGSKGQVNSGATEAGLQNYSAAGFGMYNQGGAYGQVNQGATKNVQGFDPALAKTGDAMTLSNNAITAAVIATDAIDADAIKADAITEIQAGLALEATLTAIKGAGWTTETLAALHVLIDAIKAKTDNLPTSPAATGAAMTLADGAITASKFDESTAFPVKLADTGATQIARVGADSDTLETLSDQVDAVKAKTDMITTGITVLTIASPVIGSTITAIRGDTLVAVLEGIGSLVGYSKVYFTVKRDYADADTASIIQIEKTAGLKYLNGAAGTPANGSLTIVDEASGDITIALDEVETAKLDPGVYSYDVQVVRTAGSVSTLTAGTFEVAADVTRATS